jgi:hypothetical protein
MHRVRCVTPCAASVFKTASVFFILPYVVRTALERRLGNPCTDNGRSWAIEKRPMDGA